MQADVQGAVGELLGGRGGRRGDFSVQGLTYARTNTIWRLEIAVKIASAGKGRLPESQEA